MEEVGFFLGGGGSRYFCHTNVNFSNVCFDAFIEREIEPNIFSFIVFFFFYHKMFRY